MPWAVRRGEDLAAEPGEPAEGAIHPKGVGIPPIVGAIAGAAAGAVLWGLIARFTGYEVGFVAWGIGGLVGGGAAMLGGRSGGLGLACAVLALASIFGGKMLATHLVVSHEFDKVFSVEPTQEDFDVALEEAAALVEADTDVAIKGFMIEYGYTEAGSVPDVDADELAEFKASTAPDLLALHESPPPFEEWLEDRKELNATWRDALVGGFSLTDAVIEDLGAMDILFAALGVMTAFKLGDGGDRPLPRRRRATGGQSARLERKRE